MLVQIFASSACTGVVCTIARAEHLEQLARRARVGVLVDAADDARQRRDLLDEVVLGDPLRHVRDEHVLADREAALLLEVAGDELGRAGRDRRAQHERLARAQHRQQVVEHRADVATCRSRCARGVGVPSVSTMWSAPAASSTARVELQAVRRRARARAAPGCRAPGTASRPARDRSQHASCVARRRRSRRGRGRRSDSASGSPTRPRPTTETSCRDVAHAVTC